LPGIGHGPLPHLLYSFGQRCPHTTVREQANWFETILQCGKCCFRAVFARQAPALTSPANG
jgi:hypothetical protein